MRKRLTVFILLPVIFFSCGHEVKSTRTDTVTEILSRDIQVGDACDLCEYFYKGMPSVELIQSHTAIADSFERGERMLISGIIYKKDGKTPAPDVVMYVYHTNAAGYYFPAKDQDIARRHGHLRGWVKSNDKGEYSFSSIRPAPYPDVDIPAHIHPIIKEPRKTEYWVDEYVFDDDPKLTPAEKSHRENRGGSGIMHLVKNSDGVWIGKRNIILGMNVPNYK